jgi:prolyl-tRNA editing enzyme YbaK/EbsC (Cys-tRNA(Pro) deacylase)
VLDVAARKGLTLEIVEVPGGTRTAAEAARALDAEIGQIVKSLVFVSARGDGTLDPVVVLVAGSDRVDPRRLAAVMGLPGVRQATAQEAHELTGFAIGAIPPFGHRNPIPVVMDANLSLHETVWAAAGTVNAVFASSPAVLRSLANATVAPVAEEVGQEVDEEVSREMADPAQGYEP